MLGRMTSHTAHPFDEALALSGGPDIWQGQTSPAYANMVGPFGGVTAAVLLKPLLLHPQRLGDPIALTVNFAAALQDGPFTLTTQVMRTNRSTQHWLVTLTQADAIAATATAVFAVRREAWDSTELAFPGVPVDVEPMTINMMPEWTKRYTLEMVGGINALFSGGSDSSVTHLLLSDNPPRQLDFLSLTACCDIFFPRIMARLGTFVPSGTVSFTVYFHADAEALAAVGAGPVVGHARGNRFMKRYFDQSAEIWTPSGDLLATSSQIVYYKT